MQQDNLTINLTIPTGWDTLDDYRLRYVFGLLSQGFPSPQVKTYCLFRCTSKGRFWHTIPYRGYFYFNSQKLYPKGVVSLYFHINFSSLFLTSTGRELLPNAYKSTPYFGSQR